MSEDQDEKEMNDETEDMVTLVLPVRDSVMIALGGKLDSDILKKLLRKQIIQQQGLATYVEIQDEISDNLMLDLELSKDHIIQLKEQNNNLLKKLKAKG